MDPNQFLDLISYATTSDEDLVRLGTISAIADPPTKATVIFDGEDVATSKEYFIATEDFLANGDRVILIRVGHSWLIMGRVASVSGETQEMHVLGPLTVDGNVFFNGDRIVTPTLFGIEPSTGLTWIKFRRDGTRDYIELAANDDIDFASNTGTLLARLRHTASVPQARLYGEIYLDDVMFAWFPGNGYVLLDNINEIRVQDGSASDPPLTFITNESTGFYLAGAIQLTHNGSREYHFAPGLFTGIGDDTKNLGTGSHRWSAVWAVDGTINTSDAGEKTDIVDSDLGLEFIKALRPRRNRWRGRVRPHYTFIAQEVKEALDTLGVEDFAGYIDPAVDWKYDEEDPELSGEEPPPMGLRYHEFIAPMAKAIQELSEEVETLKRQVEALERRPA